MDSLNNKNMNLAICATGELYGGVERFVNGFAKCLQDEMRISPLVVLFQEGKQYKNLKESGIDTIIVQPRWKYDLLVIRRLANLFRDRKIDVVHTM